MKTERAKELLKNLSNHAESSGDRLDPATAEMARAFLHMLSAIEDQDLRDLKMVNRKENLGSLLMKFAELSKFGKSEWVELIQSYGLELPLNPRDSARDVMGRLARYLRDHPDALEGDTATAPDKKHAARTPRSGRRKRALAENLQDTLNRLLDE